MENSNLTTKVKPKRRPLQIVIRWVVITLVFLVVAWAFMPIWLPVGSITRGVCDEIKKNTGLDVSFGSVDASWGKGLVLTDFVILPPEGFGDSKPMLTFRRFHCDFSPIRMALGMKLNWCEIDGLEVNAEVDQGGNVNLGPLKKLQHNDGGGMNFGRVSLCDSKFTLNVDGSPQKLIFGVRNLQFVQGRLSSLEKVTMTADIEQNGQAAPVNLQLSAKAPGSSDVARGMLNFVNVDLAQIPLPAAGDAFPLAGLAGRCDGRLEFHVNRALQVESLTLDLELRKLLITPAGGEAFGEIPRVSFKTQAALDALDEGLDINNYSFEMPGLKISGSGDLHSEFFAGNWRGLEFVTLAGIVEPQKLREIFGNHADFPERFEGKLDLRAFAKVSERTFRFGWDVDARNAVLSRDDEILKPAGDAMSMSFSGSTMLDDDSNTLAVDKLSVNFGKNVFTGGGKIENLSDMGDMQEDYRSVLEILRRLKLHGTMQFAVAGSETPLNGTWSIDGGRRIHMTGTIMADDDSAVVIGDVFNKPAGKSAHVDVIATLNPDSGDLEKGLLELTCGNSSLQLNDITVCKLTGGIPAVAYAVDGKIDAKRLEELADFIPSLNGDVAVKGEITGTLKGVVDENVEKTFVTADLNLSKTDIRSGDNFIKKIGDDFTIDAKLGISRKDAGEIYHLNLTASDSENALRFESVAGENEDGGVGFKFSLDDMAILQKHSPGFLSKLEIEKISGGIDACGVIKKSQNRYGADYNLVLKPKKVSLLMGGDDVSMDGEIKCSLLTSCNKTQNVISGEIDAGKFRLVFNGDIQKSPAMPAKLTWELAAGQDDFMEKGGMVHLRSLVGTLGENRFQLAGVINTSPVEGRSPDFSGSDLHLAVNLTDTQTLAELLPQLKSYQPDGEAFVDMQFTSPAREQWQISTATFKGDNLCGVYNKRRVTVNGTLKLREVLLKGQELTAATLKTDELGFSVGDEKGFLLADLSVADNVPTGEISLLMNHFDLKDFSDWLTGPGRPESRPARLTIAEKEDLKKQADDFIAEFAERFAKADLSVKMAFDTFIGYDESVDRSYLFDKVYASLVIRDGKVAFDYNGGLAGGVSRGSYACNFLAREPRMVWDSGTIDVQATPEILPQINKDFPGNTVEGTFTNLRSVYSRLRDFLANLIDDRYPLLMVGQGKMMASNGYVVGKAAPAFVTKMFPGLNLTKYYYDKMTAFQEYQSNGISLNDAIFSGTKYDVYMNGTTDLDKNIQYTLGLQLLGSLSSADWKHNWRQGRLPLLKLKGRIEKGKLVDDVVTFPWPNESLGAIFIKNNVFYRAWLLKKQDK